MAKAKGNTTGNSTDASVSLQRVAKGNPYTRETFMGDLKKVSRKQESQAKKD